MRKNIFIERTVCSVIRFHKGNSTIGPKIYTYPKHLTCLMRLGIMKLVAKIDEDYEFRKGKPSRNFYCDDLKFPNTKDDSVM